ncbi:MAG TPA: Gfo/Idh/MocA family oxidoreductase [Planctomicrobium sp.]|nr:Gfo/Idh/MocA family oxidoreductase [Planctomicrobium sp.]
MNQAANDTILNRREFVLATGAFTTLASFPVWGAEPQKKWRVGVIGHTGRGGYGHGLDTMWSELPETEVVGFADADPKGREKEKAKLPNVPDFADYRKLLEELKPEIVAIGPREIAEHHEMILAAAASGAKGIYIEKPFCRTLKEADEIIEACSRSGMKVAVAHRNRFHPVLPVVVEAVKGGEIGDLLEIRCRGKEDHRGGCLDLWVLGSHDFDLSLPISGKPIACSAAILQGTRPAEKQDIVNGGEGVGPILGNQIHARFEMENGLPLFFDSIQSKGIREANFGVQLIGNKGIIDLRVDVEPLAHLMPGNPFRPTAQPRQWIPISSAEVGQPEPIANLGRQVARHLVAGRDLLAAIRENRDPLSNEKTSRTVVEMTHAIFTSHVQNGARIALPLENREHGLSEWL